MQGSLTGRVTLVTGAGRGIGRATAARLACDGATVVLADIDGSAAAEAAAAIGQDGGHAAARTVDIADPAQCAALVAAVLAEHDRLDVLVNNAATVGNRIPFLDVDEAEWRRVVDTNLTGTAFLSQAAARHMVAAGAGAIINLTSIQRLLPVPTYAAYVASKGGIAALTRALAVELSPHGVRANAIDAGVIATDAVHDTLAEAGQLRDGALPPAATLLGRSGRPEEIAALVAFLAGDDSSYLTGAVLTADGGRTLSRRPDAFEASFGSKTGRT